MKKTTKTKRRASQTPPHKPDDCPGCLISEVNDRVNAAFASLGCNSDDDDVLYDYEPPNTYDAVVELVEAQRALLKLARRHGLTIRVAPTLEADA